MLYRGIAARAFERIFQLADFVQVKNASLEHGLLHVDLVREIPEAKKPRSIPIGHRHTCPAGGRWLGREGCGLIKFNQQVFAETTTPRETGAFCFGLAVTKRPTSLEALHLRHFLRRQEFRLLGR